MPDEIAVEENGYGVLVRAQDRADMEHRFWFDVTEAERLVFAAEIIEDGETEGVDTIRHYVPDEKMDVPDSVRSELSEEGYDTIVDTDGRVV